MIVAHEQRLTDSIELVRTPVSMASTNAALLPDNPLGKLPTLICEDGSSLFDSRVICHYFDGLGGGGLRPTDPGGALAALRAEALGDGLLDLLVLWRNELGRPAERQSEPHLTAFVVKTAATLDRLEREADARAELPLDLGHVAVGCALGYVDFRFPDLAWRTGRPRLADWHQGFERRPSAIATRVPA